MNGTQLDAALRKALCAELEGLGRRVEDLHSAQHDQAQAGVDRQETLLELDHIWNDRWTSTLQSLRSLETEVAAVQQAVSLGLAALAARIAVTEAGTAPSPAEVAPEEDPTGDNGAVKPRGYVEGDRRPDGRRRNDHPRQEN